MRFPIYPITRQDESFVDSHPCHSTNPHFARLVVTGRRCSNSGTRRRGPLTKTAVTRNGDEFGIAWYCIVWYFIMVHGIACQMVLHGMALYHCWLWRAGCISKDTYLLYFSIFLSPDNKYIKTNKGGQIYWASINEDKSFSGPAGSVICADGKWRIRWRPIRSYWVAVGESVIPEHQSSGIRNSTKVEPGRTAATTVPYILYILHCNGWVCEEENIARIANAVMLLSLKYLEKVTSLQSHLISPRSLIFYPWSLICYPWSLIIDPDPRSYIHKPVGSAPTSIGRAMAISTVIKLHIFSINVDQLVDPPSPLILVGSDPGTFLVRWGREGSPGQGGPNREVYPAHQLFGHHHPTKPILPTTRSSQRGSSKAPLRQASVQLMWVKLPRCHWHLTLALTLAPSWDTESSCHVEPERLLQMVSWWAGAPQARRKCFQ